MKMAFVSSYGMGWRYGGSGACRRVRGVVHSRMVASYVAPVSMPALESVGAAVRLRDGCCEVEVERVISCVYAQLLGARGEEVAKAESLELANTMFRLGMIPVRALVAMVCKSAAYRLSEPVPHLHQVFRNFERILGRSPNSQEEVARHLLVLQEDGFEAEVDLLVDSEEYQDVFGEDVVPHTRKDLCMDVSPDELYLTLGNLLGLPSGSAGSVSYPNWLDAVVDDSGLQEPAFEVSFLLDSNRAMMCPSSKVNGAIDSILGVGGTILSISQA